MNLYSPTKIAKPCGHTLWGFTYKCEHCRRAMDDVRTRIEQLRDVWNQMDQAKKAEIAREMDKEMKGSAIV